MVMISRQIDVNFAGEFTMFPCAPFAGYTDFQEIDVKPQNL